MYLFKEERYIKLLWKDNKETEEILELFEESPDDEDMVMLELKIDGQKISCKSENFFQALVELRKYLEEKHIQIISNGAASNVYPSPMSLSMGAGRLAYKLNFGNQAKTKDLVDIFDCDDNLKFVGIDEQLKFYQDWLKSLD